jgi:hypothetical protein
MAVGDPGWRWGYLDLSAAGGPDIVQLETLTSRSGILPT